MARLLVSEKSVFLLHPLIRIAPGGIFARHASGCFAFVIDPFTQSLADALSLHLTADLRRWPKSFDIDQFFDLFGVKAGKARGDIASQ